MDCRCRLWWWCRYCTILYFIFQSGWFDLVQTVSANYSFFLAMVLYPEVQKKAQEELDRVVGSDRLPTFADRKNLPYINALVKESIRWHPVAPLGTCPSRLYSVYTYFLICATGLPHVPIEDSIVNGYFIPKGSIIMANIW